MGSRRELKWALERYWSGQCDAADLQRRLSQSPLIAYIGRIAELEAENERLDAVSWALVDTMPDGE